MSATTVRMETLTGTHEVEVVRPGHWLVDAVRTAPRALVWGTGFALGLVLIGADRFGALALEHVTFRLVGL